MVRTTGIEPVRASPKDFKPLASTSFATSAPGTIGRAKNQVSQILTALPTLVGRQRSEGFRRITSVENSGAM
jgi:hypothetical protein